MDFAQLSRERPPLQRYWDAFFTKYQELLWKQGLEREYLRVGFSAPLFEDIEWPLMDFILEAPSFVSIYFTCTLHSLKGKSLHATY